MKLTLALGLVAFIISSNAQTCVFTSCGAANEWCASGAQSAMLTHLGCDPQLENTVVVQPGTLDQWYSTSSCAARITNSQGAFSWSCTDLSISFNTVIQDCFVNENNGLGWMERSPGVYLKISTCAGVWNRGLSGRVADETVADDVSNNGTMTRQEELEGISQYLLENDDKTVHANTTFSMPYSQTAATSLCAIAQQVTQGAILKEKYGC